MNFCACSFSSRASCRWSAACGTLGAPNSSAARIEESVATTFSFETPRISLGFTAEAGGELHVSDPTDRTRTSVSGIPELDLGAGALYTAYGGRAYPFMALLSAAGLVGVWQLRRAAP